MVKKLTGKRMSKMYKELTSKGINKKKAFKYIGQKKREEIWQNLGTIKRAKLRRKYKDSDKDGVPNKWDCGPYNRYKQDSMNFEEELKEYKKEKAKENKRSLKEGIKIIKNELKKTPLKLKEVNERKIKRNLDKMGYKKVKKPFKDSLKGRKIDIHSGDFVSLDKMDSYQKPKIKERVVKKEKFSSKYGQRGYLTPEGLKRKKEKERLKRILEDG